MEKVFAASSLISKVYTVFSEGLINKYQFKRFQNDFQIYYTTVVVAPKGKTSVSNLRKHFLISYFWNSFQIKLQIFRVKVQEIQTMMNKKGNVVDTPVDFRLADLLNSRFVKRFKYPKWKVMGGKGNFPSRLSVGVVSQVLFGCFSWRLVIG